jgi:hypothetical protein
MKKIFFLSLFITISYSYLFSQKAIIKGIIKDEKGEPIFSANVVIDANKGIATSTDFDGNYKLNLEAGKYTVSYKYVGMQEQIIIVNLAAGEEKIININLKEKEEIINTVVISASKYEKKLSEETVSLEVMKNSVLQNQNVTIDTLKKDFEEYGGNDDEERMREIEFILKSIGLKKWK